MLVAGKKQALAGSGCRDVKAATLLLQAAFLIRIVVGKLSL